MARPEKARAMGKGSCANLVKCSIMRKEIRLADSDSADTSCFRLDGVDCPEGGGGATAISFPGRTTSG